MLRFQVNKIDNEVRDEKKRHRRHSRKQAYEPLYVEVDVGTPKRLKVSLDNVAVYRHLHDGERSKLFHTKTRGGEDEVVVVRWAETSKGSEDKDDEVISMVPDQSIVPAYKAKQKFVHQGRHVSVGIRKYIDGESLSSMMRKVTPEQLDHYKLQVSVIAADLANVTSEYYGSVLNGGLKASTVHGYISACNLIEKLRNHGYVNTVVPIEDNNWNTECRPRLCHGALWPDHIIVKGTSVEGIVGWSSADFMPESVDRYLYRLWYTSSYRDRSWRRFLYDMPVVCDAGLTNTAKYAMIQYAQSVATSRARHSKSKRIAQTARDAMAEIEEVEARRVTFAGVEPLRPKPKDEDTISVSDQRSLSSLTDHTIDTWERATATTTTTIKPCLRSSSVNVPVTLDT